MTEQEATNRLVARRGRELKTALQNILWPSELVSNIEHIFITIYPSHLVCFYLAMANYQPLVNINTRTRYPGLILIAHLVSVLTPLAPHCHPP